MTWGLVAVAGATLVGGFVASNASSKAASAQAQGADQAAQVQREGLQQQEKQFETTRTDALDIYNKNRDDALSVYNTSRGDLAPYRDIGSNALLALSDTLGIARPKGFEATNTGNPQFRTDPGYKFAFDEGLKAVDARFPGMSRSGAKAKALTEYGQGAADQQYGNWLSRLSGLASVGQTATGQSASLGSNLTNSNNAAGSSLTSTLASNGANNANAIGAYSSNTGNILQSAAAARASGYVGGANAITGAANNFLSLYGMTNNSSSYGFPNSINVTPPLWNT